MRISAGSAKPSMKHKESQCGGHWFLKVLLGGLTEPEPVQSLLLCNRCVEVRRRPLLLTWTKSTNWTDNLSSRLPSASLSILYQKLRWGHCTCVREEGHGCSGVAGCPPVLWLIVEARGLRSGQLAQGLVHHFGLAVLGGQRVAGGVAEQDGRRQRGGEEDVSVLLGVLGCGGGIACRLLETEGGEQRVVRRWDWPWSPICGAPQSNNTHQQHQSLT